jgi:hypothetical protein
MARPNLETRMSGKGGTERLQWPKGQFPHGIQFIFKDYDYSEFVSNSKIGNLSGDGGTGQQWQTASNRRAKEKEAFTLELPFPSTLTDSTGVQIASFERGFIEEFLTGQAVAFSDNPVEQAKKMGNAIASAAGGAISGDFGDADFGKNADMIKRLIGTLGTKVLGEFGMGEKSIGAALGSVQNPLTTLHFSGVDLRTFSFAWSVYPSSAEEANDIRDIVNKVKSKILPRVQALSPTGEGTGAIASATGGSLARAYLKYPSVVFINLLGVNEAHYPKFKACMCKGIDINYADNGGAPVIAQGGVPMGINISMSFMELEIQTAEDYGAASASSLDIAVPNVNDAPVNFSTRAPATAVEGG